MRTKVFVSSRARVSLPAVILVLVLTVGFAPLMGGSLIVQNPVLTDLALSGINEPQGIAYHPTRQTFFIVAKNPPAVFGLTTGGVGINSFPIPNVRKPEGIAFDPVTGDLLICRGNNVVFRARDDGTQVVPFMVLEETNDADGIAVHPKLGTVFVADDDSESVFEFDRSGRVLSRIPISETVPGLIEPQGGGFYGTDLVVSDDLTDALYLVAPDGTLLQTLFSAATLGVRDPEGVTLIEQQRVCMVSDNDSTLLCLELSQSHLTAPMKVDFPNSFVGVAAVNTSAEPNQLNAYGL